jgi:hypothetical protein
VEHFGFFCGFCGLDFVYIGANDEWEKDRGFVRSSGVSNPASIEDGEVCERVETIGDSIVGEYKSFG